LEVTVGELSFAISVSMVEKNYRAVWKGEGGNISHNWHSFWGLLVYFSVIFFLLSEMLVSAAEGKGRGCSGGIYIDVHGYLLHG